MPFGPKLPKNPRVILPLRARLILFPALLLPEPLSRKRLFHAALFPRLHVEAVPLDLLDDVLLLHLALKTAQSVFQRLTFLNNDFCQVAITPVQLNSLCEIKS
jgi:hypothetical protein